MPSNRKATPFSRTMAVPCTKAVTIGLAMCFTVCRRIAAAIQEAGLAGRAHPQDYLQFFCLGKRESNDMYWGQVSATCIHTHTHTHTDYTPSTCNVYT